MLSEIHIILHEQIYSSDEFGSTNTEAANSKFDFVNTILQSISVERSHDTEISFSITKMM